MDTAAAQARETARKDTGKFGTQPHADSGVVTLEPAPRVEKPLRPMPHGWHPDYTRSFVPGAYLVNNVEYLTGEKGYISNAYPDRQWRIGRQVTDMTEAPTFSTRGKAAAAEYRYATSPTVVRAQLDWLKTSLVGRKATPGMDPGAITWCERKITEGENLFTDAGLPIDES